MPAAQDNKRSIKGKPDTPKSKTNKLIDFEALIKNGIETSGVKTDIRTVKIKQDAVVDAMRDISNKMLLNRQESKDATAERKARESKEKSNPLIEKSIRLNSSDKKKIAKSWKETALEKDDDTKKLAVEKQKEESQRLADNRKIAKEETKQRKLARDFVDAQQELKTEKSKEFGFLKSLSSNLIKSITPEFTQKTSEEKAGEVRTKSMLRKSREAITGKLSKTFLPKFLDKTFEERKLDKETKDAEQFKREKEQTKRIATAKLRKSLTDNKDDQTKFEHLFTKKVEKKDEAEEGSSKVVVKLAAIDQDLEFMKVEQQDGENDRVVIKGKLDDVKNDIYELGLTLKKDAIEPPPKDPEEEEKEKEETSIWAMIVGMFGILNFLRKGGLKTIIGKFFGGFWDKTIKPFFLGAWAGIKNTFNIIRHPIKAMGQAITFIKGAIFSLVDDVIMGVKLIFQPILKGLFDGIKKIFPFLAKMFPSAATFLGAASGGAKALPARDKLGKFAKKPPGFLSRMGSSIKSGAISLKDGAIKATKFVGGIASKVGSVAWATAKFALKPIESLKSWITAKNVTKALSKVKGPLFKLLGKAPIIGPMIRMAMGGYEYWDAKQNKLSPRETMIKLWPHVGGALGAGAGMLLGSVAGTAAMFGPWGAPIGAFVGGLGGDMLGSFLASSFAPQLTDMMGLVDPVYTVEGSKKFMAEGKAAKMQRSTPQSTTPKVIPLDVNSVTPLKNAAIAANERSPERFAQNLIRGKTATTPPPEAPVTINQQINPRGAASITQIPDYDTEHRTWSGDFLKFLHAT